MDLKALVNIEWGLTSTHILPVDHGLINRTWLVRTPTADYILQNVNTIVFREPQVLQDQIVKLTNSIQLPTLVPLKFLPTKKGLYLLFSEGQTYRLSNAITPSLTLNEVTEENTRLAAKALIEFHVALGLIKINHWKAPIKHFLEVPFRIESYQIAMQNAKLERLVRASRIIDSIQRNWDLIVNWQHFNDNEEKCLIHGDPKLSNFLFHPNKKQVRAIIDWDTIQFGNPYYDYADMVRSYCSLGEDLNSRKSLFRQDIFEALQETFQVDVKKLIVASCGVILIQAIRFLTDFLQNDKYYKIEHDEHNLFRAENQLKLALELKAYGITTHKLDR